MLQAADTDLFNPLVPKAHNREYQNLPFPAQIWTNLGIKSQLKLVRGFLIFR